MKMKKLFPVIALLMGLTTLGGCTNNDQKIIFTPLWNQYSNADKATINETLTYDVTFEKSESTFINYDLAYKDGIYTTNLVGVLENGELVYTYSTKLSIVAQFTLDGKTTEPLTDTVTSTTKFKAANFGFQPISSSKEIISHSPVGTSATELDGCYNYWHYKIETTYLNNAENGECVLTRYTYAEDGTALDPIVDKNEFEIDQEKFSYLDNEQLLAAIRCMQDSTTSTKVNVYSPFVDAVQKVSVSFAADASNEFSLNGETKTITYRPASIVLDEQNPGATQTAWYAKYEEVTGVNKNRNVLLYLETPFSYNLGVMKYTLKTTSYTE